MKTKGADGRNLGKGVPCTNHCKTRSINAVTCPINIGTDDDNGSTECKRAGKYPWIWASAIKGVQDMQMG